MASSAYYKYIWCIKFIHRVKCKLSQLISLCGNCPFTKNFLFRKLGGKYCILRDHHLRINICMNKSWKIGWIPLIFQIKPTIAISLEKFGRNYSFHHTRKVSKKAKPGRRSSNKSEFINTCGLKEVIQE